MLEFFQGFDIVRERNVLQMEASKGALERETEELLSLELSVGGSYGKSMNTKNLEEKHCALFEKEDSRSDSSCNYEMDLEIIPQTLMGEHESCVEEEGEPGRPVKGFHDRAEDREKNWISETSAKNGARKIALQMQRGNSGETYSNCSDTCENQPISGSTNVKRLKIEILDSRTKPEQTTCTNQPESHSSKTSSTCSTQTSGLVRKPPKPPIRKTDGVPIRKMPRVSTTGNGPNGKTITGFLYKYTKTEVSIVCVCHRRFFSPAGFVEHAGGVDISNPLRHITIVNSAR